MERYVSILIGILAIAGIVVMVVKRPKLSRWLSTHRTRVARVAPFFFIAWGGTIWALIIAKNAFDNVSAMVAGSLIICAGVFSSSNEVEGGIPLFRRGFAQEFHLAQRSGFAARDVRRGFAPPVAYKNIFGAMPPVRPEALNY